MKQKNWANLQKLISLIIAIITFGLLNCGDMPPQAIKHISNIKPVYEFKPSDAAIMSLALSPNQDFIVVGTGNSSGGKKFTGVSIWEQKDWNSKELEKQPFEEDHKLALNIHTNYSTQQLAISQDGKMIIGQSDDYIWKWDIENKSFVNFNNKTYLYVDNPRIQRSKILPHVNKIIVNQDIRKGGLFGFGSTYVSATIFELTSGRVIKELTEAKNHVRAWGINSAGSLMGTVLYDGTAIIWDLQTGKIIKNLKFAKDLWGLALSNNYIVTFGEKEQLKLLDSNDYKEIKHWIIPDIQVEQMKISPDEKYIVFRSLYKGLMGIIGIESGKFVTFEITRYKDSQDWPSTFIISHDSKALIVGADSGIVRIFDIQKIMAEESEEISVLDLPTQLDSLKQLNSSLISLSMK